MGDGLNRDVLKIYILQMNSSGPRDLAYLVNGLKLLHTRVKVSAEYDMTWLLWN